MAVINQFAIIFWKNWKIFKNNRLSIILNLCVIVVVISVVTILALLEGNECEFEVRDKTELKDVFINNYDEADTIYFVPPENQSSILVEEFIDRFKNVIKENTSSHVNNFNYEILSEQELEDCNNINKSKIIAGVVFGKDYTDYTIRINGNKIVDSSEYPVLDYGKTRKSEYIEDDRNPVRIDYYGFYINTQSSEIKNITDTIVLQNKILYYKGKTKADTYIDIFLPIQITIDNVIIQLKTNGTIKGYSADIGKLSKHNITYHLNDKDDIRKESYSGYAVCIFVIFIGQVYSIIYEFLKEKESGVHECLISIGANRIALWFSWILIYLPYSIFTIFLIFMIDQTELLGDHINYFLYFVYLILYAISIFEMTICSCLLIRKTKPTLLVVTIAFFMVCAVNEHVYNKLKITSYAYIEKIISLIFPPIGVGMASSIITFESNCGKNNCDGYIGIINGLFKNEFGIYFLFMVIDIIFYFILAVVIDYNRDWYSNVLVSSPPVKNEDVSYALDIQEDPFGADCFVQVRNIYKYFKFKKNYITSSDNNDGKIGKIFTVNNNISFNVYKDEIFGILGQNGAGKSTLIQIMIGMLKPNSGECFYHGLPLSQNKNVCQHHMGICLQNNVLIEDFTVVDHFIIYCNVKEVMDDIDTWLQDIDLVDKKFCKVQYLSEGQKRKLCIGLAFLGDPKYVFLDEPTTGLDPVSRRKIWRLLLKKKKNRVIFITTHYMDEADIIADRKLILKKGTIRCMGTSIYLKNHFQMQYKLEIETNKPQLAEDIVKYYVPEAEYFNDKTKIEGYSSLPRNLITSHIWKLSIDSSPLFSYLIKNLEEEKQKGDIIRNFSISAPRLEELFVLLANENVSPNENENGNGNGNGNGNKNEFQRVTPSPEISMKNAIEFPNNNIIQKPGNVCRALRILRYRLRFNYRKKLYLGIAFVIPFIIYAILFNHNKLFTEFKENKISSELYRHETWNYEVSSFFDPQLFSEQPSSRDLNLSYISNEEVNEIGKLEDHPPYVSSFSVNNTNNLFHFNVYYNDSMPHALPATFNLLSNAILNRYGINETIQVHSFPQPYFNLDYFFNAITYTIILSLMLSYCGFNIVYEKKNNLLKQLQLNGISNFSYWLSLFLSDYIWFILSSMVMIIAIIIFNYEPLNTVDTLTFFGFFFLISGIPCILYQYIFSRIFTNENIAFIAYFFINIFPMFFIVSTSNGYEISNNKFTIYVTLLLIDTFLPCFCFVEVIMVILAIKTTNSSYIFTTDPQIIIHIVGVIFSILFYCYVLCKLVKSWNKPNHNNVYSITEEIKENFERELREGDEDVYYEYIRVKDDKEINAIPIKLVNLVKEYNDIHFRSHDEFLNAMKRYESPYGEYHLSKLGSRQIVMTAFENINLGIDPCECFGILGPNGSGKTSLLNTVSFTFKQSAGEILFNGKNTLERKANEITLGYCPQKNTLWNEMTLYEHIEMFLYIRGCSRSKSKSLAKQFIQYCRLTPHENKYPTEMSGGTRRKLNILIALCCDSSHVLLDEPSAGMDPATRRYIWDVIKATLQRNQSSIIMTTHSMEEAELLCNRVGIIVDGKLQCIGTPEHLKMKYSHTYILDVHTENVKIFHKKVVEELCLFGPGAQYKKSDKSQQRVKYEIKNTNDVGRVFEIMEACRDIRINGKKLFIDYSYSQTTLEEVFFNFARLKENYNKNDDSFGSTLI